MSTLSLEGRQGEGVGGKRDVKSKGRVADDRGFVRLVGRNHRHRRGDQATAHNAEIREGHGSLQLAVVTIIARPRPPRPPPAEAGSPRWCWRRPPKNCPAPLPDAPPTSCLTPPSSVVYQGLRRRPTSTRFRQLTPEAPALAASEKSVYVS